MLMRGTWVGCWDGETKGENGEEGEKPAKRGRKLEYAIIEEQWGEEPTSGEQLMSDDGGGAELGEGAVLEDSNDCTTG